jgi:hypothetical protein
MRPDTRSLILQTLAKPHSLVELSAATGIGVRTVQRYLNAIRAEKTRTVRIDEWRKGPTGWLIAFYVQGTAPDARRPKRPNAKPPADPESRWEEIKRRKLADIKPFRDPFTAVFFGPATK